MTIFSPDSNFVERVVPSPNYGKRRDGPYADILLLHYTGMKTAQAALERLCDASANVSCHYMVYEDGVVVQMVPEALRAHHAGLSSWAGDSDINSRSIGIEIVNPGHDYGYPDYPERQIQSVIQLCRDIVLRNNIPSDNVLAHSDVAPLRKQDPGEKFPWHELFAAGVGLWVSPSRAHGAAPLSEGAKGASVSTLQKELADYGYAVPNSGIYDALTTAVVVAFQRHFRPQRCDGIADASTRETLRALLAARTRPA